MSENTKIEWADHTFNPWEGCQKVGPGCDHCYAEARNARFSGGMAVNWGPGAPRRRTSEANWGMPLKWDKRAAAEGRRYRVFCSSLADAFDAAVPMQWRGDLFALIRRTPNLDWLLLTKRIGKVVPMLTKLSLIDLMPLPHVWIGATVVNQAEANRDIPKLLAVPARVRFLSIEPMLGPVSLTRIRVGGGAGHGEGDEIITANVLKRADTEAPHIDWVICGGESGPKARPMHPQWARDLRDQCKAAGTPFLFKQWGEWVPRSDCYHRFADGKSCADMDPGASKWPGTRLTYRGLDGRDLANASCGDDAYMQRVGKAMAGRLLDGETHDAVPITEGGAA